MMKIGIAGTIAAGKTTVSILLKRRGMPVFNSDQYARMATHRTNVCFDRITEALGKDLIGADGDIDRALLAKRVFSDEEARKTLNAIVHPYVREGLLRFFERNSEMPVVFAEVPLLFEAGWQDMFDQTVVVTCTKETAIQRMMEDRDYTEEEALARYESQIAQSEQTALADRVIHNDGTLKDLDHEINLWIRDLRKEIRNGSEGR